MTFFINCDLSKPFKSKDDLAAAYQKFRKAILIGGLATASKNTEDDLLPSEELCKLRESLLKKHHKTDGSYQLTQGIPLRQIYGGDPKGGGVNYRGFQYSLARLNKYFLGEHKTKNYQDLIKDTKLYICHKASIDVGYESTYEFVFGKVKSLLKGKLAELDKTKALGGCLTILSNSYFEEAAVVDFSQIKDEKNIIIQLIAMIDLIDVIEFIPVVDGEKKSLNYAEYIEAMVMMNMSICSFLEENNWHIIDDNYYKNLIDSILVEELPASETLVSYSGRDTLDEAMIGLELWTEDDRWGTRLAGFALPLHENIVKFCTNTRESEENSSHGYFAWINDKVAEDCDQVALLGRSTETKYDLTKEEIDAVIFKVQEWGKSGNKTLVFDCTIPLINTNADPILDGLLNTAEILKYIRSKQLDIILVRSEQKQQTLGTGKFAAGSAYLISNNLEKIRKFNKKAEKLRELKDKDQILATFYRKYVTDGVALLTSEQSKMAKIKSESDPEKMIGNGPFLYKKGKNAYGIAQGFSFGFIRTNFTAWNATYVRIDPGVETRCSVPLPLTPVLMPK